MGEKVELKLEISADSYEDMADLLGHFLWTIRRGTVVCSSGGAHSSGHFSVKGHDTAERSKP